MATVRMSESGSSRRETRLGLNPASGSEPSIFIASVPGGKRPLYLYMKDDIDICNNKLVTHIPTSCLDVTRN